MPAANNYDFSIDEKDLGCFEDCWKRIVNDDRVKSGEITTLAQLKSIDALAAKLAAINSTSLPHVDDWQRIKVTIWNVMSMVSDYEKG